MAKTAVINPRRRKRAKRRGNPSNPSRSSSPRRRRRRNYGAAARAENPRRRRAKRRRSSGIRRRNPGSSMGLGRARNPSFDLDGLMDTIPSATGGVWAARYAVKLAGPFEAGQPGISHAIAIWLAAHFGGQLIGQVFGSPQKGEFARIAALGFGGDLFLRKRFLKDSKWAAEHIMLDGVDDYSSEQEQLNGFENSNQLGDSFTDAVGNQYVQTAQGWALAGLGDAQLVQGADGQVYQLGAGGEGYDYPAGYDSIMEVSGFENSTQLGFGRASGAHSSSFGYA